MSAGVTICEGGIADLEAVMRVMNDSFDPAYGEAWTSAQCAGLMPMPGVWLSLARKGDEVIGFALARIVLKEAELLLLAVKHDGRRRGIGRMLLDRFILVGTSRGADRLHLEVRDGNPAMELYARSGFAEVGRRKNYYTGRDGQIYDALTLTRAATV
jgi:[ribosomal protein S18]-alanine N-acetyltransferase